MTHDKTKTYIECPNSLLLKVIMVTAFAVDVIFLERDSFGLFFVTFFVLLYFTRSPDVTAMDEGVELGYLWGKQFVTWDAIRKVRKSANQLHIHLRNPLIPFPIFVLMGRRNYKELVKFLTEKLDGKVVVSFFPFLW